MIENMDKNKPHKSKIRGIKNNLNGFIDNRLSLKEIGKSLAYGDINNKLQVGI